MLYQSSSVPDTLEVVEDLTSTRDVLYINLTRDLPKGSPGRMDASVRVDSQAPHACAWASRRQLVCGKGLDADDESSSTLMSEMVQGNNLIVRYTTATDTKVDYQVPLSYSFPVIYGHYHMMSGTVVPQDNMGNDNSQQQDDDDSDSQ
jgi:hypothetical protein